jgi:BioD-like phosphotransacetylase family protein
MRYLMIFFFLLLSSSSFAFEFVEIQFKKGTVKHVYQIESNKTKSSLSLKEGKKALQLKIISQGAAEDLISEANRIVWKSAYRKPAAQKKCSDYLTISIDKTKPEMVCQENRLATAHAYGFMNKLSQIIEK